MYQAQVKWGYRGQLECLTCGLAVCYAGERPQGAAEVPELIPSQQALEDGASSYAGEGGDGKGKKYKTATQELHEWKRALVRYQRVLGRK